MGHSAVHEYLQTLRRWYKVKRREAPLSQPTCSSGALWSVGCFGCANSRLSSVIAQKQMCAKYRTLPIEDTELDWPKNFFIWNSEGKMILYGRLQPWTIWGGEYPYSDAFSYEFYFEKNNLNALQNYFIDIFMKNKIFIHEILCGHLHKKQMEEHGFFSKLQAWLRKKDI